MLLRQNKRAKCKSGFRSARFFTAVYSGISNLEVLFGPRQESELKNWSHSWECNQSNAFQTKKAEAHGFMKNIHMYKAAKCKWKWPSKNEIVPRIVQQLFHPDCHNCLPQTQSTYNDTVNAVSLFSLCSHLAIRVKKINSKDIQHQTTAGPAGRGRTHSHSSCLIGAFFPGGSSIQQAGKYKRLSVLCSSSCETPGAVSTCTSSIYERGSLWSMFLLHFTPPVSVRSGRKNNRI